MPADADLAPRRRLETTVAQSLPPRDPPADYGQLKIIVTGTPKAGNTWIRHVLAALYQLPMVRLNPNFSANNWAELGPRWIGQQHYHPQRNVLAWARSENVVFITPVRHPGDVLVSLRHDLQMQGDSDPTDPLNSMLGDPPEVFGEHTLRFVQTGFFLLLHLSIKWLRGGWSYPVRYEDLWRDPLGTLRTLTNNFLPMPDRRLRHALCSCDGRLMQSTFEPAKNFVRLGGLGSWREALPPPIRAVLESIEPYPAQFAALHYTMDPADPANVRSMEPAVVADSPVIGAAFANGVPIDPILVRAYFDLPENLIERWPDATPSGDDSFYAWLNQPAAADPLQGRFAPVITELAHYLHRVRPDVARAFPDPFGADRIDFVHWFLFYGTREFQFDRVFTLPPVRSWAVAPLAPDSVPAIGALPAGG